MNITQRGVLPPVNFVELDASVQASLLGPAGARLILPADLDATLYTSGAFAPAWTGFSVAPVGNLTWIKFRGLVWLYNNTGANIQGTSNAVSMSITNVPAAITPTVLRGHHMIVRDDGSPLDCWVEVTSGSVVNFFLMDTFAVANRVSIAFASFTAVGNKGWHSSSGILYPL